jgi:hypothetical protein
MIKVSSLRKFRVIIINLRSVITASADIQTILYCIFKLTECRRKPLTPPEGGVSVIIAPGSSSSVKKMLGPESEKRFLLLERNVEVVILFLAKKSVVLYVLDLPSSPL